MNLRQALAAISLTAAIVTLTGCGIGRLSPAVSVAGLKFTGDVHGGQQPVVGVTMQLYAAGSSGYGSASTPLLSSAVLTDSGGRFSIPAGAYTCPSSDALIYIAGTGGNPIAGQPANTNLAMIAGLGRCADLGSTFISMNEVTTVAAVWALAPFMADVAHVGTSSSNSVGLVNAFASINKLVDLAHGTASGPALPVGASIPVPTINSLANILAACVNTSGGVAGDHTPCGDLFDASRSGGGIAPADVVASALNIARNPAQNVVALNNLQTPQAPFQPTVGNTPPTAWTLAIRYKANNQLSVPGGLAADQAGNVWIANAGASKIVKLDTNGAVLSGSSGFASTLVGPAVVAVDQLGNAWTPGATTGSIVRLASSGTATTFAGADLGSMNSLAIDKQGSVWSASTGGLSAFASDGTQVSPLGGYTGGGINGPVSIAIAAQ